MINIIRSELSRLFKSKGFYISLIIYIAIYVLCIFMQINAQESLGFQSGSINEPGLYISVDTVITSMNAFATTFGYIFGVLVLGIYLSSFVTFEYSSGFIKNIAVLSNGRKAVILSKIAVAFMMSVFILMISYGLSFILGTSLIDSFEIESLSVILYSMSFLLLVSLAVFSLIIFICTLFKNKTAGIVLVFLIASGMLMPFINSILDMIHLTSLSEYTLSYLFMNTVPTGGDLWVKAIFISIFYIIVYNILSIGITQKRDL